VVLRAKKGGTSLFIIIDATCQPGLICFIIPNVGQTYPNFTPQWDKNVRIFDWWKI
jgi:hypothetical protein